MIFKKTNDSERRPCGDECLTLLPDVSAILNRLNNRGPRRRSTNAEFFKPLDEAGFSETGRRCGVVTLWSAGLYRNNITDCESWQQLFSLGLVF